MSRAILLTVLTLILMVMGLATLRGDLLVIAIPLVTFLIYGLQQAPPAVEVEIRRTLESQRAVQDSPVMVTLEITHLGHALIELLVEDQLPAGLVIRSGSPRHLLSLGRGESFKFSYSVSGSRGSFAFEAVRTHTQDILGLFPQGRLIPATGQFYIFPWIVRLGNIAIRPRRTRVYAGSIPARLGGSGLEFFGVRDYQAGDPPRVINWRATARHATGGVAGRIGAGVVPPAYNLISNEFLQERVADVGIVLDGRIRTNLYGVHTLFEHSVLAAAALSNAFLNQGNRVGLLVYGSYLDWTLPGYGKLQRERILHALARASLGSSSVFAGLEGISPRMFQVESQIILISPLTIEDLKVLVQLRARGYQVMVVSPDPLAFENGWLHRTLELDHALRIARLERTLLMRRLRRAGVQVVEWNVSRPFDQAVHPQLRRYRPHIFSGLVG